MTDLVTTWRTGTMRLDPSTAPCPGIRQWPEIRAALSAFVNGEAATQAAALGWRTLDLFGVHNTVGAARGDCTGALVFGRAIDEIRADRIRMGNLTFYRKAEPHPESVAIWDYREPRRGRGR